MRAMRWKLKVVSTGFKLITHQSETNILLLGQHAAHTYMIRHIGPLIWNCGSYAFTKICLYPHSNPIKARLASSTVLGMCTGTHVSCEMKKARMNRAWASLLTYQTSEILYILGSLGAFPIFNNFVSRKWLVVQRNGVKFEPGGEYSVYTSYFWQLSAHTGVIRCISDFQQSCI